MNNIDYSIYLVTDKNLVGNKDFYKSIEYALESGVSVLQVREKDVSSKDFYLTALKLKELCTKYNVPIIVNDRLDIALAIDADGLHIGQKDLPIKVCRQYLPNKIIGVSANTYEQAKDAYSDGADYIGLGAIYPTNSKNDAIVVTDDIDKIIKDIPIPIVGIGGINDKNCNVLAKKGFSGVAVISAILGKDDIKEATRNLADSFRLIYNK